MLIGTLQSMLPISLQLNIKDKTTKTQTHPLFSQVYQVFIGCFYIYSLLASLRYYLFNHFKNHTDKKANFNKEKKGVQPFAIKHQLVSN